MNVVPKSIGSVNRVIKSPSGKHVALWRGEAVYENGCLKEFAMEANAWLFLAQCDAGVEFFAQNGA
jgi:hypothetical protein